MLRDACRVCGKLCLFISNDPFEDEHCSRLRSIAASMVDDELQHTLQQLCLDLLDVSTSSIEQRRILESLTSLVEAFPLAQRSLGRLFAERAVQLDNTGRNDLAKQSDGDFPAASLQHCQDESLSMNLLTTVTSRCMYYRETARSTISLLAALANRNSINQRRILRSVSGVRLAVEGSSSSILSGGSDRTSQGKEKSKVLYVLTVPDAIKKAYRQWRKRRRNLERVPTHGRIPTGSPPSKDGVPAPCYCDDCLGSEQLLATWSRHFNDLSRWTAEQSEDGVEHDHAFMKSSLSTSEFLHATMDEYRVYTCSVLVSGLDTDSRSFGNEGDNDKTPSKIYYFVPIDAVPAERSVSFDPTHHLSAIRILPEVDDEFAKAPTNRFTKSSANSTTGSVEDEGVSTNELQLHLSEVVLLTGRCDVVMCAKDESSFPGGAVPDQTYSRQPTALRFILTTMDENGQVLCADLLSYVNDQDNGLFTDTTRMMLQLVLLFCSEEDLICVDALDDFVKMCHVSDSEHGLVATKTQQDRTQTRSLPTADFVVMAHMPSQSLRIECTVHENAETEFDGVAGVFSAGVPLGTIRDAFDITGDRFGLLSLAENDILSLVRRCCVCICEFAHSTDEQTVTSAIHLRRVDADDLQSREDTSDQDDLRVDAQLKCAKPENNARAAPMSGLSEDAKVVLVRIRDATHSSSDTCVSHNALPALIQQLVSVIKLCNARIKQFASDTLSSQKATGELRLAAMSRCRECRDALIRLCKEIKLHCDQTCSKSGGGAPALLASRKQAIRLQSTIHASISDVLECSERFDPWEVPDERVAKMALNRNVWASGVPDFEFHQARDARNLANKREQRELSRKLQARQRHHQSQNAWGTPTGK